LKTRNVAKLMHDETHECDAPISLRIRACRLERGWRRVTARAAGRKRASTDSVRVSTTTRARLLRQHETGTRRRSTPHRLTVPSACRRDTAAPLLQSAG